MPKVVNQGVVKLKKAEKLKDLVINTVSQMIDLSLSEKKSLAGITSWNMSSPTDLYIHVIIPFTKKQTQPSITLNDLKVYTGSISASDIDITEYCTLTDIKIDDSTLKLSLEVHDVKTISSIKDYNVKLDGECILECKSLQ